MKTLCLPMFKFLAFLFLVLPLAAQAAATGKLKNFIASTRSGQADFSQEVLAKSGKRIQRASGTMQFVRPGKFRWIYLQPYEQQIVGDGEKFWLHDVELNQVTVKRLDAALGSSPAALLAGSNEIERGFALEDSGERNGLDWLQATPRSQDTSFEKILMAFDAQSDLVIMELHDALGQKTVLRFSGMQRNPKLSPQLFNFIPPKGADVLGE
ncbi:MAG: outer membrane lipoprotein carrier protein [Gallionellaceae bacterium]|nr:MAG: outer membrane lipoprotein carrier protein [Gallionellaceae bacterium]